MAFCAAAAAILSSVHNERRHRSWHPRWFSFHFPPRLFGTIFLSSRQRRKKTVGAHFLHRYKSVSSRTDWGGPGGVQGRCVFFRLKKDTNSHYLNTPKLVRFFPLKKYLFIYIYISSNKNWKKEEKRCVKKCCHYTGAWLRSGPPLDAHPPSPPGCPTALIKTYNKRRRSRRRRRKKVQEGVNINTYVGSDSTNPCRVNILRFSSCPASKYKKIPGAHSSSVFLPSSSLFSFLSSHHHHHHHHHRLCEELDTQWLPNDGAWLYNIRDL